MNTEHRLCRLERTLGTLITWSQIELGLHNTNALLDMLNAPEDPDCIEEPGHTPQEVAQNARELDAVAPMPAEKFPLMFGARDTPETEAVLARIAALEDTDDNDVDDLVMHTQNLERQRNAARKERDEARSLVAAFENAVNQHCTFDSPIEKDRAVSEVDYIFRLYQEFRDRVEKVIGHWRDTDKFALMFGANERQEAVDLMNRLTHALSACLNTYPDLRASVVHGALFEDYIAFRNRKP